MKFDLSCLGHVLYDIRCYVDSFPLPDKLRIMAGMLKHGGGGSAANVAVDSTKLGLRTGMIGKVGFDEYGWFAVQNFRNWGVNTVHILVDFKSPTRVSLIIVNGKGIPEFIQMIGASDPSFQKKSKQSPRTNVFEKNKDKVEIWNLADS